MTGIEQVGAAAAIITINSAEVVQISITSKRIMKMDKKAPTKKIPTKERVTRVAIGTISATISRTVKEGRQLPMETITEVAARTR